MTLPQILSEITKGKIGVEIGGPSNSGTIIYENATNIDNVIFSEETVWSSHKEEYNYYPGKQGRVIISDAVDIPRIKDASYDFCFSSHSLEHIANPLKAIREWIRIIKPQGYIIFVVPEKSLCFDHNREYSKFSTLLAQYEKKVGEDDLSTLPEILKYHDLEMDAPAGNFETFTKRSLDNYNNRCLHHYVYNDDLFLQICDFFDCDYIFNETQGIDRWFIIQTK